MLGFRQEPRCARRPCEVPEEYGHARRILLELVLANNWKLEVVVGISLAIHAFCFFWCIWAICYQGRHRRPRVGRHVVGFHMPSLARRSLNREFPSRIQGSGTRG